MSPEENDKKKLEMTFSNVFEWKQSVYLIKIALQFVSGGPVDNEDWFR